MTFPTTLLKYILLASLFLFISACSNDEQPDNPSSAVETKPQNIALQSNHAATYQQEGFKLIFFLNPNGGPCRMQNSILSDMANELKGKIDIQYVQTTVAADRDFFNQYGIRGLPTLLLADASGKEIKRLPPGVKRADDIRTLIQSIPHS